MTPYCSEGLLEFLTKIEKYESEDFQSSDQNFKKFWSSDSIFWNSTFWPLVFYCYFALGHFKLCFSIICKLRFLYYSKKYFSIIFMFFLLMYHHTFFRNCGPGTGLNRTPIKCPANSTWVDGFNTTIPGSQGTILQALKG
jgi:hypothetical protein